MPFLCLAFFTLAFLAGCSDDDAAPTSADWQQQVKTVMQDGSALYSFRFTSDSASGVLPHFSIQLDAPSTACARYTGTGSGPEDFWFVDVKLSSVSKGTYAVSVEDSAHDGSMIANVALLHRLDGTYAANFPATRGTVMLPKTLSVDAARNGSAATIELDVDFPAHAVERLECRGGQPASGGPITESCSCRDESGMKSSCVPKATLRNCCIDMSDGLLHFARKLSATACAGMCRQVVGLNVDYCGDEQ